MKKEKIEKTQEDKEKQKKSFYKVLGIIADIIMYPVLIISLVASFGMLFKNRSESMPSVFGYSVVRVKTGSMVEKGFKIGDVVFVKKTSKEELKVGDIVAFYKYYDPADYTSRNNLVDYETWNGYHKNQTVTNRKTKKDLKEEKRSIYFHQIVDIKVSTIDGTIFYETKGSNPGMSSDGFIREDFVLGEYVHTPRIIRSFCSFCASPKGMIILVVLPLSFLILLQCLSIIEQINNMILENKVFLREERFDSPESIKAHIMKDMEDYKKIFFYLTTSNKEKVDVATMLWGHLVSSENKKDNELKEVVDKSIKILNEQGDEAYFDFWEQNINATQRKKLIKLKNEYQYEKTIRLKMSEKKG